MSASGSARWWAVARLLRGACRGRRGLAAAALALPVLCGACGEEQTPSEPPPGQPPSAEGAESGEWPARPELPANFPKDVPIYPGAVVTEVHSSEAGELYASFRTGDSLEQIESFYLKRFAADGWTTRNPKPQNPEERAIFADKGRHTATVILFGSPESRRIDVYLLDIEPSGGPGAPS